MLRYDSQGQTVDFHSLRHTCGAWLALRNVNPKVIQAVMRHSSISLTLDTYGHLMPSAHEDAIKHFSELM
ncbi:tyrosine-type recombinase/integrase [Candidatus Kaiserbacteria bacterium]|nr:tyrosine-type recombinase/integrase [Candidatus Kaiserbacteria bacterium]